MTTARPMLGAGTQWLQMYVSKPAGLHITAASAAWAELLGWSGLCGGRSRDSVLQQRMVTVRAKGVPYTHN